MGLMITENWLDKAMLGEQGAGSGVARTHRQVDSAGAELSAASDMRQLESGDCVGSGIRTGERPALRDLIWTTIDVLRRGNACLRRVFQAHGAEWSFRDDEYRHCVARPIIPAASFSDAATDLAPWMDGGSVFRRP